MSPSPPTYVGMALGILSQEWSSMGLGDDPAVASSNDRNVISERITALLLIRMVAWLQPRGTFSDLSTTSICRHLLVNPGCWPESITDDVIQQLKNYVLKILAGYNDNPYHNAQHCEHVTVSASKLVDMILNVPNGEPKSYTYGYRDDPLMHFVQLFSALIHDVEHGGVPNRQLALEDDELAILYNDQSIAEMRSVYIGFSELLKPDYERLREVLFPQKDDYLRFRTATVNLVLTTDLASPDRAQIAKSKWKEAFGDDYETVERRVLREMERRHSMRGRKAAVIQQGAGRRMSAHSIMSELSLDSQGMPGTVEDDESVSLSEDESLGVPDVNDPKNNGSGSGPIFRPPLRGMDKSPSARKKSMDSSDSYLSNSNGNLTDMAVKFHRRLSSIGGGASVASKKARKLTRLGLLRTVDLSGEEIETYSKKSARPSATGATMESAAANASPPEEVDELRETVVMEIIMKAADVAHNIQSFDHMVLWSNRLFLELKKAFIAGRGDDPQGGWFNNQIGFLEAYLLPLARKLDDIGVFGPTRGSIFVEVVEDSKERWMKEGASYTTNIIREGHMQFPEDDSDEEIGG